MIRNNFREIIDGAYTIHVSEILEKRRLLYESEDFYKEEEYQNLSKKLSNQLSAIERSHRASLLICPVCFKTDKDMTYNPLRKKWYCTECYHELKKGFTEEGRPEEFP
jgi:hypothetical protein